MSSKLPSRITSVIVFFLVLAIWEASVRFGWVTYESIPTPTAAVEALINITYNGDLWEPLRHTVIILAISFAFAALAGITFGVIIGLSKRGYALLSGTLEFLRFVPPPALIPLVLLLSGFTNRTEILIAAFASVWPILLNTADGVAGLDPQLREAGKAMCLSRTQMLFKIILPAAVPTISVGLRIALSLCLILVITTEIVAIRQGLGFALVSSSSALQFAAVYAYLLTVGLLGVAVNIGYRWFERYLLLRGWRVAS